MLCHLEIDNLAIVKHVEVEWRSGMTTITGETGAGKSIGIDALSLCLGSRADAGLVRPGANKTEVSASFDISKLPQAKLWLEQEQLNQTDSPNDCLIRRVISKEGRSRAYINGSQVPLQQLRTFGEHLISIHGQHAHQLILKPEHQRTLIDQYANHSTLLTQTETHYKQWKALVTEQKQLIENYEKQQAQKQLLEYQVSELNEFDLQEDEWGNLEQEHKRLANGQDLQHQAYHHLNAIYEGDESNAYRLISSAAHELSALAQLDESLQDIAGILHDAAVQVEEAGRELSSYVERIDLDPARLADVEQRVSQVIQLARKHQVQPADLYFHHQKLLDELTRLNTDENRLHSMDEAIAQAKDEFLKVALALSESRIKSAAELTEQIQSKLNVLSMENAKFEVFITQNPDSPSKYGIDTLEFLVSANSGQPLQPLGKVASGGELSRISLAIQVIIGANVSTPTLIFDEVDVGVSGPTAIAVGKLLKQLGNHAQIICVTHLPQVAAQGHQQLFVCKQQVGDSTETFIKSLDKSGRIDELARLLGGENITAATRKNAKELLAS